MNQNYLSGLCFPAVAGLFFFMKRPEVKEIDIVYPVYSADSSGLTGVDRYLEKQKLLLLSKEAEYQEAQLSLPVVSGVTRYLENRDRFPVTGVTKYTRRQALAAKQEKLNVIQVGATTGVAKYLKNQKPAPVLSGVAKYIKHQESLPQASRVARYIAKQTLAAKQIKSTIVHVEATGVAKYLKHQESLPQASRVAKYIAKQSLAAKQEKQIVAKVELSGVAKYLKHQESLPQVSRVAKYVARQALVAKQKPTIIQTGVEKYVRSQV